MDFSLKKYVQLIECLRDNGFRFLTFAEYCEQKETLSNCRFVILRHDVDLRAENSLVMAEIEYKHSIKASYYFRIVEQSNKPKIIKAIVEMGHEIGYHYEDMTICKGDVEEAIVHFKNQLEYFRQFYPVKTICMHGAPRSKFDGRDLWKQYDYHNFGIIGEPYFDVDFSKVFYLTDTGRRWDGFKVSVRDKIPVFQDEWVRKGLVFHNTDAILTAVDAGRFPLQLMMTTHPQRWKDNKGDWFVELMGQWAKNIVKRFVVR